MDEPNVPPTAEQPQGTQPSPWDAVDNPPLNPPEEAPEGPPSVMGRLLRPLVNFYTELRDDLAHNNGGPAWNREDVAVFLFTTVLLGIFYYYCRPGFFRRELWHETGALISMTREHPYYGLLPYVYWAIMSVLVRMLLPCLFIWFILKDDIREYGYRLRGVTEHARIYLLLYALMFPVVFGVSLTASFQSKYPFYKQAMLGWDHFILYQLCYGVQFIALEAFFRGFIIFALYKRFGYYSLLIMCIPYCMIHFGKPAPETFGAIIAGLALGYLALKSKSWLYGGLLHWSIGITMDLLAIMHRGGFKS
ncbi:MAG: type II CAAX endopeptidase family protein [Myxococcota bacterium]